MEEKLFYTISEIAAQLGVNASLIRFWEKEVGIVSPQRNPSGKRRYTGNDLQKLQQFYHLVKVKGYTLQGAKDALKENKGKPSASLAVEKLKEVQKKLQQLYDKL
jgi:DNA-binding transcriptional MerR regulator